MTQEPRQVTVSDEELDLDAQEATEPSDQDAMSLINATFAAPANTAAPANVLSERSTAWSNAGQTVDIDQSN
jgi:hypothetical protein